MPPLKVSSRRKSRTAALTAFPSIKSGSHSGHRRRALSAVIGTTVGPSKRRKALVLSPDAQQLARLLKQQCQGDPVAVVGQAVAAAAATHSSSSTIRFETWKNGPLTTATTTTTNPLQPQLQHQTSQRHQQFLCHRLNKRNLHQEKEWRFDFTVSSY